MHHAVSPCSSSRCATDCSTVFLRLCALRVPFDAPNIPGLVQKIVSFLVTEWQILSSVFGQKSIQRSIEDLMLVRNGSDFEKVF